VLVAVAALQCTISHADDRPNFIIIYADDLGWGDLACYGHPTIRTPHLDRMASEGVRFTQFYSADSVCTPSRAALMTGRLPVRSGMYSDQRRVLFPNSAAGLPADEVTLAEVLHDAGYATGCFGKWHLGHRPEFLPTSHGFDTYFGIPYSNDMDRAAGVGPEGRAAFLDPRSEYWNVPLMRDTEVIERPADQSTITRRYTEEAVAFIREHQSEPFFVYLPHNLPHVPLFRSPEFEGVSRRGLYGDVVEEIDWSVGQVLDAIRELGLDERTYVFFSSDNGPWLIYGDHGGSAGLLQNGKGCTWEGGMRVPGIAWCPGRIPSGRVSREMAMTMDLFPTCIRLAGAELPADRILDGTDLSPLLLADEALPTRAMFYYRGSELMAVRWGVWKAHFFTQEAYGPGSEERIAHDPPLLFHLEVDPSERHNRAAEHPEVLAEIAQLVAVHQSELVIAPSQVDLVLE
jgi:arylsulfatase A-like enzyme